VDVLLDRIYATPADVNQSVIDRMIGWVDAVRPSNG
jgi:hypothetical protein